MILRPVRPESPCGPPMTKRPVGLIRYSVFRVSSFASMTFLMTFWIRNFSIVAWATSAVCCVEMTTFTTSTGRPSS